MNQQGSTTNHRSAPSGSRRRTVLLASDDAFKYAQQRRSSMGPGTGSPTILGTKPPQKDGSAINTQQLQRPRGERRSQNWIDALLRGLALSPGSPAKDYMDSYGRWATANFETARQLEQWMRYAAYALPSILPSSWGAETEALSETLFALSRLLEQLHDSAVVGTASCAGSHAVAEAEAAVRAFEGERENGTPEHPMQETVTGPESTDPADASVGEQAKLSAAEAARRAAAQLRAARRGARRSGVLGSVPDLGREGSGAGAPGERMPQPEDGGDFGPSESDLSQDASIRWLLSALGGVGAAVEVGSSFVGGSGLRDNAVVLLEIVRFFMRLSLLVRRTALPVRAVGGTQAGRRGGVGTARRSHSTRGSARGGAWSRLGRELGLAAEDVLSAGRLLLLGERRDGRDTTLADSAAAASLARGSRAGARGGGAAASAAERPRLVRRFLVSGGEADTGWARQAAEEAIAASRDAGIPLAFSWAGEAGAGGTSPTGGTPSAQDGSAPTRRSSSGGVSQRVDPSNPRVRYWRGRRTGAAIPFVTSSAARRAEAELGAGAAAAVGAFGGAGVPPVAVSVADAVALAGPSDAERVYGEAAAAFEAAAVAGAEGSATTLSTGGWESEDSDDPEENGIAAGGSSIGSGGVGGAEGGQDGDAAMQDSFLSDASSDLPPLGGWEGAAGAGSGGDAEPIDKTRESAVDPRSDPRSAAADDTVPGAQEGECSADSPQGPSSAWRDGLGDCDTERDAAPVRLLGEILWIARPLVYAIMVRRQGRRAWSPLITLFALDVASGYITRKSVDVARGRPVRGLLHAAGDVAKAGLRQLGVLIGARNTANPTVPVGRTATSLGSAGRFASPYSASEQARGHEVLSVPASALAIDPIGLIVQQVPSAASVVAAARRFAGAAAGGGGLSGSGGGGDSRQVGASSGRVSLLLRVVMRLSNQVRVAALAGGKGTDGRGSGIPAAVHGGTLRAAELDEIARRRRNLWVMYLLRSPLFTLVTRAAMLRAEDGARAVPLAGWVVALLIAYMRQTLEWWNSVFAYSGPTV